MQAVVLTDPVLIAEALGKAGAGLELEKSVETVYSKFNIVRPRKDLCSADSRPAASHAGATQLLHPRSAPTIFTSKTNDHWRLVRKGVAPAFNPKNIRHALASTSAAAGSLLTLCTSCRLGFHHVARINARLIEQLQAAGPSAAFDADNLTERVTLDVIGQVGFGQDFGATEGLQSGKANRAFHLMEAGELTHSCSCLACTRWTSERRTVKPS